MRVLDIHNNSSVSVTPTISMYIHIHTYTYICMCDEHNTLWRSPHRNPELDDRIFYCLLKPTTDHASFLFQRDLNGQDNKPSIGLIR